MRAWIAGLVVLAVGCNSEPAAPSCDPTVLAFHLSGTVTIGATTTPVELRDTVFKSVTTDEIDDAEFDYFADVFVKGLSTGGASAYWKMSQANPALAFGFQLGGARQNGTAVSVVGPPDLGINEGMVPLISGVGAAALLTSLSTSTFSTAGATGSMTVQTAAPLTALLSVTYSAANSTLAGFIGALEVSAAGPNCP